MIKFLSWPSRNRMPVAQVVLTVLTMLADPTASPGADYSESLRPQFHFTAAKNWINDPNGLVHYEGVYHLFFQYNPDGRDSAHKSWGHAVSRDLVHWTQRDTVLYPDELGEIWSGSAVVDWENTTGFQRGTAKPIVLIYTAAGGITKESAGRQFTQCLAYSSDGGTSWQKYDGNPVLAHVRGQNRDPKVVWHAPTKRWVMALYLDKHDFALLASPDLKHWSKLQEFTVEGTDECPDFFPMSIEGQPGKTAWIWMAANGRYLVGDFDGETFRPENGFDALRSEYGRGFYAGQTFSDMPDSRRVQIAWLRDGQFPDMPFNQQLSFPTRLSLHRTRAGLRLHRLPIAEIESLRDGAVVRRSAVALDATVQKIDELPAECIDLNAVIETGSADRVCLRICGRTITVDSHARTLSCLNATVPLEVISGRVELRVLVDRTSIEVFANQGTVSLCSSYLPTEAGNPPEAPLIWTQGGRATLVSLEGYRLRSIWTDPAKGK